jgi:hypothetical protein
MSVWTGNRSCLESDYLDRNRRLRVWADLPWYGDVPATGARTVNGWRPSMSGTGKRAVSQLTARNAA